MKKIITIASIVVTIIAIVGVTLLLSTVQLETYSDLITYTPACAIAVIFDITLTVLYVLYKKGILTLPQVAD